MLSNTVLQLNKQLGNLYVNQVQHIQAYNIYSDRFLKFAIVILIYEEYAQHIPIIEVNKTRFFTKTIVSCLSDLCLHKFLNS